MSRKLTYLTLTVVITTEPSSGYAQNINEATSWQDEVVSGVASGNNFGGVTQNYYSGAPPNLSFMASGGGISATGDPNFDYGNTNIRAGLYQQTQGASGADGTDGRNGTSPTTGGAGGQVTTSLNGVYIHLDFNNVTRGSPPVNGLSAFSYGGGGGNSGDDDQNAAGGASAQAVRVSLSNSDISTNFATAAGGSGAIGMKQHAGPGGSAKGNDARGGNGGRTDAMTLLLQGSTLTGVGSSVAGVDAEQLGGTGGGSYGSRLQGGIGGSTGGVMLNFTQAADEAGNTVSTTGSGAAGLRVSTRGGNAGVGGYNNGFSPDGGNGGDGGNTSNDGSYTSITVTSAGALAISTAGDNSPGISATSQGGNGGTGGGTDNATGGTNISGVGGSGGRGDGVTINLGAGASISTNGASSDAITVTVAGGRAGDGGEGQSVDYDVTASNGGPGGNTGRVSVSLAEGVSLRTRGDNSSGVRVSSQSGDGGTGGRATTTIVAQGGSGGTSGNVGDVSVVSGATISTRGKDSSGIVATSRPGQGGAGGSASGVFGSNGGTGTSGGTAGRVEVDHSGSITTLGRRSQGIVAQSFGGSGGAGARADGGFGADAGAAATGGNAGTAVVTNTGTINTLGFFSQGVVAGSIGGGGGIGGEGSGVFRATGGDGNVGGSGGEVNATLGGRISTRGTLSQGVVLQSVGGGGGIGGDAVSGGAVATNAVGGDGGNGGDGGFAHGTVQNAQIATFGGAAPGVLVQSVGGGGGTGGGALATAVGPVVSAAVAVGGSGGAGGNSHTASLSVLGSNISTVGSGIRDVDSPAVHVQSIAGGGGTGGGASAFAMAVSVPLLNEKPQGSPTLTFTYSAGGSGDNGGTPQVSPDQSYSAVAMIGGGSRLTTQGANSAGVKVQSIGGGGGSGGDASSVSAAVGYGAKQIGPALNFLAQRLGLEGLGEGESIPSAGKNVNIDVSVGGSAGDGGAGGSARLQLGDNSSVPSSIVTEGQAAIGALIQSNGGGGGDAGVGSSSVDTYFSGTRLTLNTTLGRPGGNGGTGGAASASIAPDGVIETAGSNAMGLVVQSIGGGGGVASGGGISTVGGLDKKIVRNRDAATPDSNEIRFDLNLRHGRQGGSGGDGGSATVDHRGTVQTLRNGSTGILVQSIGGGGGVGGAAGAESAEEAEARSDNLLSDLNLNVPETVPSLGGTQLVLAEEPKTNAHTSLTVNTSLLLGGAGGTGGNGGTVTVTQGGIVSTQGDLADGILAQSIGGGGGTGGTALAEAEPNTLRSYFQNWNIKTNLSLGVTGGGGAGGNGGSVLVNLAGGSVTTGLPSGAGFHSAGILAQSVGGGGGVAGSNTALPRDENDTNLVNFSLTLGAGLTLSGSGGGGGDGGLVQLQPLPGYTGATRVTTYGEQAYGVVLQSVGGGGGVVRTGASLVQSVDVSGSVSSGVQGEVTLDPVVALSLGAEGGYSGNGGLVQTTLTSATPLVITTSGVGAFGLVGQSVGGGGGIVGVARGAALNFDRFGGAGSGSGNNIVLNVPAGSTITTAGTGAHGIVAQSVGGGGGIATTYAPGVVPVWTSNSALPDGVTLPKAGGGAGSGGSIDIFSDANIRVAGAGAYGILAQSVGGGGGLVAMRDGQLFLGTTGATGSESGVGGPITMELTGTIDAIGANGIGVFAQSTGPGGGNAVDITLGGTQAVAAVLGGSGSQGTGIQVDGGNNNRLTIGTQASVGALSGVAIRQSTGTKLDVTNSGTIYGDTYLGGGGVSGNSQIEGQLPPGATVLIAAPARGTLHNQGTLVALPDRPSVIDGNLVQTESGLIAVTADFATRQTGSYRVTGDASLAGTVQPTLRSVLPGIRLPVLTVEGTTTGSLAPSRTTLFSFQTQQSGNQQLLSVSGRDFAQPALGLSTAQAGAGGALESVFDAGNPALGTFFADLDQLAASDPVAYGRELGQLAPRASMTLMARRAADASRIADASMSCPVFAGDGAFLTEGACGYFRPGLRTTKQQATGYAASARFDSATWQLGGQAEVAPNLFLGGSLAYGTSWTHANDGVKADGEFGQAAVTLKYQAGPWLLTGAAFGTIGSDDLSRSVSLRSHGGLARGSVSSQSAGLRARVAYTVGTDNVYLRPYVNVDGIYAHSDAWREKGVNDLGLRYAGTSYSTAIVTPAVEVGGRVALGPETVLRGFVSAGVSLRTNNDWKGSARLLGAAAGGATIDVTLPQETASARFSTGVQLFQGRSVDLRAQYDGDYGTQATSHTGTLTFAYRF